MSYKNHHNRADKVKAWAQIAMELDETSERANNANKVSANLSMTVRNEHKRFFAVLAVKTRTTSLRTQYFKLASSFYEIITTVDRSCGLAESSSVCVWRIILLKIT